MSKQPLASVQITAERFSDGQVIDGFRRPACSVTLDARVERHDAQANVLRMSFATPPEYANPGGTVQGGFISAMLDDTMGPLVVSATAGTKFPVSTDLHTTFFKSVPIGPRCIVEARIDRIGGSTVFTSALIMNENGAILARGIHTARLVDATRQA
jgi:acyl-coenzyme A thioesterase PaaI-like protein